MIRTLNLFLKRTIFKHFLDNSDIYYKIAELTIINLVQFLFFIFIKLIIKVLKEKFFLFKDL